MKLNRSISHVAQYTALVDILFATIGIFVIVFALQDLNEPQVLQPAPYDHLITCDETGQISYMSAIGREPVPFAVDEIEAGSLEEQLAGGGRVLIAVSGECLGVANGEDAIGALRDLEETVSDRSATGATPLTLFDFAPLGTGDKGVEGLQARIAVGAAP